MASEISETDLNNLINQARDGDQKALGQLLDQHREQLSQLAKIEIDTKFAGRVDASDVVQQTFLSACKNLEQYQGQTPQEFAAWILQIHNHNLQDIVRQHAVSKKRDVNKERQFNQNESLDAEQSTPSQQAMRLEQHDELKQFLEQLPIDQKQAIQQRYFEGQSLAEISKSLNRSSQAVASLLKRGLANLRTFSPKD